MLTLVLLLLAVPSFAQSPPTQPPSQSNGQPNGPPPALKTQDLGNKTADTLPPATGDSAPSLTPEQEAQARKALEQLKKTTQDDRKVLDEVDQELNRQGGSK
jgi:hypothetical protein